MYIDKVKITIKSGNGGKGHTSFHTEKFVPNGGPDGGDGGRGGSIIFIADPNMNTLLDFYYKKKYFAPDGERGDIKKCSGKSGADLRVRVPCGTLVRDAESGRVIADMYEAGEEKVILKGGRGGLGNAKFATPTRQAPRFSQSGEATIPREVILELKTIADVGLIGFPNVGKSTLLSVLTDARPKIANYHFTTLSPNLGVVKYHDESFVLADIPGLVEGASENRGLGHSFLRHTERARILAHIVDISGSEGRNPAEDYQTINLELKKYSKELSKLKQIAVLNKTDILADKNDIDAFKAACKLKTVYSVSAATGEGLAALTAAMCELVKSVPKPAPIKVEEYEYDSYDGSSFTVERADEGYFIISGGLVSRLARNVAFDDPRSMQYFQNMLSSHGVNDKLREAGARDGDTVRMLDLEFEFIE